MPRPKRRAAPAAPNPGRESLLRAAADTFAEVGFTGASVGDIARRAGVTQPLVNHHFGSKKGLWKAVTDELYAGLEAALREAGAHHAADAELPRLRGLLRAYVLYCGRNPHLTRMLRIEASSSLAREVHTRWQKHFVEVFQGLIDAALRSKALAPVDPQLLFFVILGASNELFSQPDLAQRAFRLDVTDPAVVERAADFVCDVIFHGVAR